MSSSQLTNLFQRGWNHQPVLKIEQHPVVFPRKFWAIVTSKIDISFGHSFSWHPTTSDNLLTALSCGNSFWCHLFVWSLEVSFSSTSFSLDILFWCLPFLWFSRGHLCAKSSPFSWQFLLEAPLSWRLFSLFSFLTSDSWHLTPGISGSWHPLFWHVKKRRCLYIQNLLNRKAFTYGTFYTERLFHTNTFTWRQLLHREASTHKSF